MQQTHIFDIGRSLCPVQHVDNKGNPQYGNNPSLLWKEPATQLNDLSVFESLQAKATTHPTLGVKGRPLCSLNFDCGISPVVSCRDGVHSG